MSDRELHDWLLRQTPRETSPGLDARVLEQAGALFAERRRARTRRQWRLVAALAAVAAVVATLVVAFRESPLEERVALEPVTLDVADGGRFELAVGARYAEELPFNRLHLVEGEAVASPERRALQIAFPGGALHVSSGRGRVTVTTDGDGLMSTSSSTTVRAARNGAVIAIVLLSGAAWIALRSDAPEMARHEISAGETVVVETERRAAGVTVTSVRREKPAVAVTPAPEPPAPPPIAMTPDPLVPLGSEWRYLDGDVAPEASWRLPDFDDASWPLGVAELGYGDGDEATTIDGGDGGNRHTAAYFRTRFGVADPAVYADGLILRVRRDDGAVVYLNGREVFRTNMPAGEIAHDTLAASTQNDPAENALYGTTVDPATLVSGTNVLAVEVHQVSRSSSDLGFDLELVPGTLDDLAPFRGRVVDAETGEPVAGVDVSWQRGWYHVMKPGRSTQMARIVDRDTNDVHFSASPADNVVRELGLWLPYDCYQLLSGNFATGADGEFALRPPQIGELLRIETEGFIPLAVGPHSEDEPVESGMVYELARPFVVAGRVWAQGRQPLHSASRVELELRIDVPGTRKFVGWNVVVRDDDTFEQPVDHVDEVTLVCSASGYGEVEKTVTIVDGRAWVDLELPPHPSVTGRVVDAAGEPLERVEVHVSSRERGFFKSWVRRSDLTGADGTFIANVDGPDVKVEVLKIGYAPRTVEGVDPAGGPLEIVLEPTEKGIVEGSVRDASGRPVAGVDVRVSRRAVGSIIRGIARIEATTDERGRFELELQPAEWTFIFHLKGLPRSEGPTAGMALIGEDSPTVAVPYVREGVEVREGRTNPRLDIVLPSVGVVAGLVVGEDGAPAPGRHVSLYQVSLLTAKSERLEGAVTDADGRFSFEFVEPGTYAVYESVTETNHMVTVRAGETSAVRLGGATSALVATVSRDGEPVANAQVVVGRIDGTLTDVKLVEAGESGGFEVDKLGRGLHLILITDPARKTSMLTSVDLRDPRVDLEIAWPATKLTVEAAEPLPEGARVVVEWLEFGGVPLAAMGPAAYRIAGEATSADRVSFTLEGVVPGKYRARTEGVTPEKSVDVVVGERDVVAPLE